VSSVHSNVHAYEAPLEPIVIEKNAKYAAYSVRLIFQQVVDGLICRF